MIPQAIVITNQLIRNLFMITSIGVIMHLRTAHLPYPAISGRLVCRLLFGNSPAGLRIGGLWNAEAGQRQHEGCQGLRRPV